MINYDSIIKIPNTCTTCCQIGVKGKSAIARQYGSKQRNLNGESFWASGYAVSIVGFELDKVKEYISQQEETESEREKGLF